MKIISSFKDYYDCIQGVIFDKDTLYLRETKAINIDLNKPKIWYGNNSFDVDYYIISFCGKLYPLMYVQFRYVNEGYFYSFEKADEFIKNNLDKNGIDQYNNNVSKTWKSKRESILYDWKKFQARVNSYTGNEKVHTKYKCPIYVSWRNFEHERSFLINPCLNDFQFYKVMDAYTTFQEIYMYLSGVLGGNNKPIPIVSDNDMIEAKGFDKKYSFRKR